MIILEFCGGPGEFEQWVVSQFPSTKRRKIKLCSYPLMLGDKLRIHKDYIELEVEEFDIPSAADVARLFNTDPSSPLCTCIMECLLNNRVFPSIPGVQGYLVGPYDYVEISDPGPVKYRISESSMIDLRHRLTGWSLDDLRFRSEYPPESHQAFLDCFLLAYTRHDPPLAMVSEVHAFLPQTIFLTVEIPGTACATHSYCYSLSSPFGG